MGTKQHEHIQEFTDSRGVTLDTTQEGVIRGVKILGLESKNGRSYPKETVARAAQLYEGAKVNIDHSKQPGAPRSYAHRMGQIRNVHMGQGDSGLFGDFHYNPKHALAEQLKWDAEHTPENVGFSHNIVAIKRRRGKKEVVEDISQVVSVDLVADPATTRGLFEGDDTQTEETHMADKALTVELLKADHPDLVTAIATEAITEHTNSQEAKEREKEFIALKEQVDKYQAAEKLQASKDDIARMIEEAELPKELITDLFMVSMIEGDEQRRKDLIEDRKAMVAKMAPPKPRSREQHTAEADKTAPPKDTKEYASALTE